MEYKSPHDYTGINDFYKVTGYACIFQADTKKELAISPNEITLTFATYHYPYKMIRFLKTFYKVPVMTAAPGITYISGLLFPIQILHIPRLDDHEYLWLSRLRPDLTENDLTDLVREYQSERRNPLYEAAMNLIIRANSEGRKEEKDMWEFLEELFPERFREVNEELEAQRRELEEQRRENQRLRKKNAKLQKKDKELQALRETIKKEQEDEKVRLLVEVCRDIGLGWKDVLKKVMETFDTDSRNAERLVKRYW